MMSMLVEGFILEYTTFYNRIEIWNYRKKLTRYLEGITRAEWICAVDGMRAKFNQMKVSSVLFTVGFYV